MRQDPEWMGKVGIGSLVMLSAMCIPVFGQLVLLGWTTLMARRAVSGQDTPLPRLDFDFDYFGKLLPVGFKTFLARLLWSLPLMALIMGSVCCMYAAAGVLVAVASSSGDDGGAVAGVGMVCLAVGFLFVYPVVVIGFSMPMRVAVMRAELTGDINAAMRIKEVIDTTKLLFKELFIGSFVMGLIGMVAVTFGLVTLYIGLFPAIVVMQIINAYWQAELYRVYLEKGGQPLAIGPLDVPGPNDSQASQPYPPQPPPSQF